MCTMYMNKTGTLKIEWECDNCHETVEDMDYIEDILKFCPNCDCEIDAFVSLYDDE